MAAKKKSAANGNIEARLAIQSLLIAGGIGAFLGAIFLRR
jgi:hypothetical protein